MNTSSNKATKSSVQILRKVPQNIQTADYSVSDISPQIEERSFLALCENVLFWALCCSDEDTANTIVSMQLDANQ